MKTSAAEELTFEKTVGSVVEVLLWGELIAVLEEIRHLIAEKNN